MKLAPDRVELDILRSWDLNARPWTDAVRAEAIASRRLLTNQAIVDAVAALIEAARCAGGGRFEVLAYRDLALRGVDLGRFVMQTLHPVSACGDAAYRDGWRAGNWQGFGPDFRDPAPWYFRTLGGWHALLRSSGFDILECREPTMPGAAAPSSIIYICGMKAAREPA